MQYYRVIRYIQKYYRRIYNPSEYTNHEFFITTKEQETKQSKINNHLYTYTKNNRFLDKQNPNTLHDFDDYVSFDTYFGFF